MDEQIMVVPRKGLFGENEERAFDGFISIVDADFVPIINKSMIIKSRKDMENDSGFKQIIPYSVFEHDGKIFIYKRTKDGNESRLHEKYSIGIGGHINPVEGDRLTEGMKREFHEEIKYHDDYSYEIIGFLNSDETSVDKVHFGVVFMIKGETADIEVAEKEKLEGRLENIDEIRKKKAYLENWSAYVFDIIESRMM